MNRRANITIWRSWRLHRIVMLIFQTRKLKELVFYGDKLVDYL